MSVSLVKVYLENLVTFLKPFLPLANSHMVEFFTDSVYKHNIPEEIKKEIEIIGKDICVTKILDYDFSNLPFLENYIKTSQKYTLKNCSDVCLNADAFEEELKKYGCNNFSSLKLDVFMTSKKSHEVEVLSKIAAGIKEISGTSHLVDIGDGKGYLSSMLALHHNIEVLGIDASEINTLGAVKRAMKLTKIWNGLQEAPKKSYPKKSDNFKSTKGSLYKQITKYVDESVDFEQLVSDMFLKKPQGLGIVGLHTCGNLASTSLNIYVKNCNIWSLCNVGCCYNLLTESYEENDECNKNLSELNKNDKHRNPYENTSQSNINFSGGFPLCNFLNEQKFTLGRRARMTGAQSVDRIFAKKELPSIAIFYRALLQVILDKHCSKLPDKRVGRIKKFDNFIDYARKSFKILEVEIEMSDIELNQYYENYKGRIDELYIFYLIRAMLSPVVESLILADRLLFLLEKGYRNSYLVKLFDPVISPRCYGLISLKK